MDPTLNRGGLLEERGPWPFTTRRTYHHPEHGRIIWRSRHHRKGLGNEIRLHFGLVGPLLARCLWMPAELNWWIGAIFALGSLLFFLGSILVLTPTLAEGLSLGTNAVNGIFFAGSIPFTTAAYLQLFQSANAGPFPLDRGSTRRRRVWLGWEPGNIGWLSCALQFVGTILFNANTFDAFLPGLNWFQEDLAIWLPNIIGSILFLLSGYLAFIETCHAHWGCHPRSLSWWAVFINLLGCIAFMISAVFAFVPSQSPSFDAATISVTYTLRGALCFLVSSLLLWPEAALAKLDRKGN